MPPPLLTLPFSEKDQMVPINLFVYSPSDTERAVTAKLKGNNAICSVDVFTHYVIGSLGQKTANRPCGDRVYCHLLNKTTSEVIATTTKEKTNEKLKKINKIKAPKSLCVINNINSIVYYTFDFQGDF